MGKMEKKHSFHYTHSNIHHILRCDWAHSSVTSHTLALGDTERDSLSDAFLVGGFRESMTPLEAHPIPHAQNISGRMGFGGCGFKGWI
jgi:hypothetical protein